MRQRNTGNLIPRVQRKCYSTEWPVFPSLTSQNLETLQAIKKAVYIQVLGYRSLYTIAAEHSYSKNYPVHSAFPRGSAKISLRGRFPVSCSKKRFPREKAIPPRSSVMFLIRRSIPPFLLRPVPSSAVRLSARIAIVEDDGETMQQQLLLRLTVGQAARDEKGDGRCATHRNSRANAKRTHPRSN